MLLIVIVSTNGDHISSGEYKTIHTHTYIHNIHTYYIDTCIQTQAVCNAVILQNITVDLASSAIQNTKQQ